MTMNTKKQPLQTLKGFRDFLPREKRQRDFVLRRIVETFEQAGFQPLETPTLEYRETIMGKYGEEADKLVYSFEDNGGRAVAMRYDQTVPTARVIAQYPNELPLPFRRYQSQSVFRADKPQRGRYREFQQCDIDIFGSTDPMADAEILATTYRAFRNIGFRDVQLKVNDRQVLYGVLGPFATDEVNTNSIIQSIDKLDKMSAEDVAKELVRKGLSEEAAQQALSAIQSAPISPELERICNLALALGVAKEALVFTPTIARGLDYYTGMIFEIAVPTYTAGSLGGGGRYDNLIGDLSGNNVPAVGVAYGFDRVVEAAVELGYVPAEMPAAQVLVAVFSEELVEESAKVASELRDQGIAVELYPRFDKIGKQFKYADRWKIPYVAIVGPEEAEQGKVQLKDMVSGEQQLVTALQVRDVMNS